MVTYVIFPLAPRRSTQSIVKAASLSISAFPGVSTKRRKSEKFGIELDGAPSRSRNSSTVPDHVGLRRPRSEEHTSELQSLMRISYAVLCLKKKKHIHTTEDIYHSIYTPNIKTNH